jgi:hypothetical protein
MRFVETFSRWDKRLERRGLRVLATIPVTPDGRMPFPPGEPFLEGVRFLRAALQTHPASPCMRRILTVAVGGTACAADMSRYLARSFAETGRSAAFVPLDCAGGDQSVPGVSDFLAVPSFNFTQGMAPQRWDRVQMVNSGTRPLVEARAERVAALLDALSKDAEFLVVWLAPQAASVAPGLRAALAAATDCAVLAADRSTATVRSCLETAARLRTEGARTCGAALCHRQG